MPTVIGIFFFCCGAYCFLFKEGLLFGLLIVAGIFEASSALNISGRGIQPYYVIATFIIMRAIINWALGSPLHRPLQNRRWLLLFGAIAIASAFILPIVYSGIPVYDSKIGIDDGLFIRPPLRFGLNNIGQVGFLAIHIGTAFALLKLGFSAKTTRKAFLWGFYIIVLLVFAQSVFQFAGVSFPDSLIRNNPGYTLTDSTFGAYGTRNSGPCTEPSIVGAFLVLYIVGFFAEYLEGKRGPFLVIVGLIASGLVASSGSIATLGFVIPILLICYSPFRFPWYFNLEQARRMIWILVLVSVPLIISLVVFSSYQQLLVDLTVSKGGSSSAINRTAADIYGFELLARTHWIGVGLGSSRSSSLLATLLSNIGIVGTSAFLAFYFRLFGSLGRKHAWLKWGGFALLLNMVLGIADVTMPLLWIPILLAIQLKSDESLIHKSLDNHSTLVGSSQALESSY